ncbi:anti-sigma factor [Miltoncostaea marina]|uniref:anti-sigma factor n=1 Tax=Miltoncostaea marina TaxID=2843215 RepID=UPI001C3CC3CC|nr:anti-sigma factor [Miltoncostaea marina]
MTREHDAVRDLIAPVVLGAAGAGETARVEAHAATCAVCQEELAALRAGAGALAVAVPQHDPPPRLKASIMATVRAEAAPEPAGAAAAAPRRSLRSWLPGGGGLRPVVAGLAAVAALLLGWNVALQVGDDDGGGGAVTTLEVAGTSSAPAIGGRLVWVPGEDAAVVELGRLPALGAGEAFQLWVLRAGEPPRSAGLFEPTGPGAARAAASGLAGADGLAVTAQPRASRSVPEGPILAQVALAGA